MTSPFGSTVTTTDYLDIRQRQGNLMIVKVWDQPEYVRTKNQPDGMVYPRQGSSNMEPFPNRVIRAAVADITFQGPNGVTGKIYAETWFQANSLMKLMRKWIGQGPKLVIWRQHDPTDKSSNYWIEDKSTDTSAVEYAMQWLSQHPEWDTLEAPAPYDGKPPAPQGPPQTAQQPWGGGYPPQQWQQGPPPGYPQPGYNAPQIQNYMNQMPPQGQPWQQQPPVPQGQPWQQQGQPPQQQWGQQPPAPPQQPPAQQWGQQPGYQQGPPQQQWQQQGPPPGQAAPTSFLGQMQQGAQPPAGPPPQQTPVNGWGQPQTQEPPF